MSDEERGEPPKKGIDLSKLAGLSNGAGSMRVPTDAARAAEAIKAAMPSQAIQDAMKAITDNTAVDALRKVGGPTHALQERMRALTGQFGPDSNMGKLAQQLQDQQRSIDALRMPQPEPLRIPDLRPPPNPIHETNDRLERIEERFEQMLDVAANGAEIATGLQAHAAEFLVKFESAATANGRSTKRAIVIGAIAVVIAIAMPVFQIAYTELWRVPQDTASMTAVITDIQAEIATLRQTQIEAADRISAALERSDQQMVDALRDVARSLAAPPPASVGEAAPAAVPVADP